MDEQTKGMTPLEQKVELLRQKVDKILVLQLEAVKGQAELLEQNMEILEKLNNIGVGGEGWSVEDYGPEN